MYPAERRSCLDLFRYVMKFFVLFFLWALWGIGLVQAQELRTGTYSDGTLRYRGYFVNDRPCGEMTRFYPGGEVKAKMNHRGDTVDVVLYSQNGEFTCAGRYIGRKKTGRWEYRKEGHMVISEPYKNNRLQGVSIRYFASGQEAEKKSWRDGKPDGPWILYYTTGTVRMEGEYADGKLSGPVKSYDRQGNLRVRGTYKDDRKEGIWFFYDAGGQLQKKQHFRAGISDQAGEEELEESRQLDSMINAVRKIPDPAVFADEPEVYMKITGENFPEE